MVRNVAEKLPQQWIKLLRIAALSSNVSAIDVVELVVRYSSLTIVLFLISSSVFVDFVFLTTQVKELETDPLFNSGRGSALTEKGTVEMEASIMDGTKRRCGAVSGITTVKNPISLARLVMDKSPHSYLAFSGAEDFARKQGVEIVDNEYFVTEDNVGMLKLAKEANSILVSVDYVIKHRLDEGFAGLIAVSNKGEVVCGFNSNGMFRGCATEDGYMEVAMWE
ncbi:hypothetical protein AALP_AAs39002U000300 [Arabis alpina]|uniref:Isoaspartyl peptidase/L-asparaginase 2 n=1 Tax=Arabis alpina TaxID=50452 RepID=A0A087G264_ARAAL|nr:hypothetical protein AALP_AAs39002U000300 [Arabis alpina]